MDGKGRFQRLVLGLDRGLSGALIILVAAMVLSVTLEIVLNAVVQPILSSAVERSSESGSPSGGMDLFLEWGLNVVAASSAPVNTASQTLLVWVAILGSALALRQRAHLGVDAFVRYYPDKVRLALDYVATALIGLFSLFVLVIGGYLVCRNAFVSGSKMPGLQALNRGWLYLVLVIAGILNLVYCVYHVAFPRSVASSGPDDDGEGEST